MRRPVTQSAKNKINKKRIAVVLKPQRRRSARHKHIVMFSGGIGSWAAAKRVVAQFGRRSVTLLFTDTKIEDRDLYRFLHEAAENVGAPLIRIADGRSPWQVFRDERFLGNARVDPCSKILKRELADRWLAEHCDKELTSVYLGIDWTESHRFERVRERQALKGWTYFAPLCDPPYLSKKDLFAWLESEGLRIPRLYRLGFAHNNCGGFCVKAGQGHFARLLAYLPKRYREHEAQEERLRRLLGKDVSILVDRRGGGTRRPLTLAAFRERLTKGDYFDRDDVGGCGCFSGDRTDE